MRRVASQVLIGVAVVGVWVAMVVLGRPPSEVTEPDIVGSPGPTSAEGGDPESAPTDEEIAQAPGVIVAGSGPYVADILQGYSFDFYTDTGYGIQFEVLGSTSEVWRLHDDPDSDVDVVEIGFRLEALAGEADEHFLPIDPSVVPTLHQVPEWLRIDANGIVPGIEGALGLIHVPGEGEAPASWDDLTAIAESGRSVVIPGPPLSLAVVFVHALGGGDVEAGLEAYAGLVGASAVPARTTAEFQQALADGAVAGAWSSNGAVSTDRSITLDADFIVPASGAVVLPAFTGIRRGTASPEAALAWLEFRLGEPQEGMSFDDLISRIDGPVPIPLTPVMDTGRSPLIHTGIDPFSGEPFIGLDWAAVAASRDDVIARLEEITGG